MLKGLVGIDLAVGLKVVVLFGKIARLIGLFGF